MFGRSPFAEAFAADVVKVHRRKSAVQSRVKECFIMGRIGWF